MEPWLSPSSSLEDLAVRFTDVSMDYEGSGPVLNRVSFDLAAGSFHYLTGASGAGKTTLLKLIYMALKPSRGGISLFGIDAVNATRQDMPELRRQIGVVYQEFRLLEHLSVFDNVALPLRVMGQTREAYLDDVRELLHWVGLGAHMNARPQTLSGGEKQRVAIARAVVAKPALILADEPTGNVDPEMGERIMRLFLELNRFGATVLIATHDLAFVRQSGAPALRLEGGRLIRAEGRR